MRKSKKVVLTLLGAIALATLGCNSDDDPSDHEANPYDQYSYAGKSGDQGQMYMHYSNGLLNYYLISRMFDGYGYRWNMPYYRYRDDRDDRRNRYYGHGGSGWVPRVYSGSARSGSGVASAHSTIGRGGFGGTGMSHGIGG